MTASNSSYLCKVFRKKMPLRAKNNPNRGEIQPLKQHLRIKKD